MFYFENLRHSKIERLQLFDAPRFNVDAYSVFDFVVRNMTIWVNTELQKKISGASTNIPMFPFNTDGIDVHGRLIHVHDINISNFDDAVAVKSSSMEDVFQCTENVLIERISVFLGVGLSIGSVPPTVSLRCVRNVTFRHINAVEPLKFIYIKTGESSSEDNSNNGAALIENITYENMKATSPVFWPIYLGPQQQSEPDGTGQGWIQVPTNPDVTIRNIVFRNITVINNRLRAGVLRCNSTNPCTGIVFSNVIVEGGLSEIDGGYICDDSSALVGYFDTLSHPVPDKCMALSEAKTVQPRNPF
jgi:polygalacturonase